MNIDLSTVESEFTGEIDSIFPKPIYLIICFNRMFVLISWSDRNLCLKYAGSVWMETSYSIQSSYIYMPARVTNRSNTWQGFMHIPLPQFNAQGKALAIGRGTHWRFMYVKWVTFRFLLILLVLGRRKWIRHYTKLLQCVNLKHKIIAVQYN